MHVRPITREDLPEITTIFCEAFLDNELFAYIAPYRHEYPLAWRLWGWQKELWQLNTPGRYGFVCVSDDSDHIAETGQILGYAWWFRMLPKGQDPSTDPYMQNNRSWGTTIDRYLRKVEEKYWRFVSPLPALSPTTEYIIDRTLHSVDLFAPLSNSVSPTWHLSALAVSPKHQRRGIGDLLLDWGIERAKVESASHPDQPPIPIRLHATVAGRGLYVKRGFSIIAWGEDLNENWRKEMAINPRKEIKDAYDGANAPEILKGGGCAMLYDPTGFWIREPEEEVKPSDRPIQKVWTDRALEIGQPK